jgi:hypothetical protein
MLDLHNTRRAPISVPDFSAHTSRQSSIPKQDEKVRCETVYDHVTTRGPKLPSKVGVATREPARLWRTYKQILTASALSCDSLSGCLEGIDAV